MIHRSPAPAHRDLPCADAEYRFLCTLLTAPDHYLKVAFRLLDRDGSGDIELREFFSMTELLGSQTRQRQLAMNTNLWATAGSTEFAGVLKHSHLLKQLFGPKGDKRVTFEQFRSFAIALQRKVLHIEFLHNRQLRHPDARDDKMNELTFAKLFLKQSQLPRAMRAEYYTRIQEVFGDSEERTISFDDVYLLFTFLQDTEMVEMALNSTLHLRDDNRLRQDDLQHISQVRVAPVGLVMSWVTGCICGLSGSRCSHRRILSLNHRPYAAKKSAQSSATPFSSCSI